MRKIIMSRKYLLMIAKTLLAVAVFLAGFYSGSLARNYYDEYQAEKLVKENKTERADSNNSSKADTASDQIIVVGEQRIVVPREEASDEEKGEFSMKMMELAQDTNQVTLKDCTAEPPVIKLSKDKKIEIKNIDTVEQAIRIDQREWVIPSLRTESFQVDFKNGAGLYGMMCRGKQAGMIYVIE